MSVILEINRDFPYQVALPFDEDVMDVLDWLEGREFQWDMPQAIGMTAGDTISASRAFTTGVGMAAVMVRAGPIRLSGACGIAAETNRAIDSSAPSAGAAEIFTPAGRQGLGR